MRILPALVMVLAPVALAVMVTARLVAQAPGPGRVEVQVTGPAVRVAPVAVAPLVPQAQAWGAVRAAQTWTAVSEVRGAVIWRAPDLETGLLLRAGEVVLRIDPADYDLAIAQAEADLAALAAEAAQLVAEGENTARVLALEEARLALSESDARRTRELVAQGSAAPARGDEAARAELAARRAVVELQNALALVPPRQDRIAAQRARTEAALARARRDLSHTEIRAPFDLRVTAAPAALHQVVSVGQALVSGEGLDRAEVVAQLPVAAFRRVLSGLDLPEGSLIDLMDVTRGSTIAVTVEPLANPGQMWPGRLTRVEPALDPRARTVQAVIEIADPYEGARPPERIPLVPNLQVAVTLTGPALPGVIAIPAGALHGDTVYLADAADRLELRSVTLAFRQGDLAVIGAGLAAGERLVLDDIAPALPGMALRPVAP